MQLKVFGLMVELNNLRTLLKRTVLYLNTNQSNHLRLRNQYCLRGRFKQYLNEGGGVTKRASSSVYIIPSTYTAENLGIV